jgi:protoporphyrinogen oxidase
VTNHFGRRLFRAFFQTYTEKVWGSPCTEISADWAAQRIKGFHLGRAMVSALMPGSGRERDGAAAKTLVQAFRYPRLGPGMLWESCADRIREMGGRILLGARVTGCRYDSASRTWTVSASSEGGETRSFQAEAVLSSAAMSDLVRMLSHRFRSVRGQEAAHGISSSSR